MPFSYNAGYPCHSVIVCDFIAAILDSAVQMQKAVSAYFYK